MPALPNVRWEKMLHGRACGRLASALAERRCPRRVRMRLTFYSFFQRRRELREVDRRRRLGLPVGRSYSLGLILRARRAKNAWGARRAKNAWGTLRAIRLRRKLRPAHWPSRWTLAGSATQAALCRKPAPLNSLWGKRRFNTPMRAAK